jgi:hypothetical protein
VIPQAGQRIGTPKVGFDEIRLVLDRAVEAR